MSGFFLLFYKKKDLFLHYYIHFSTFRTSMDYNNIILFISGLSFFFLGLQTLEKTLATSTSKKIEFYIQNFTNHPIKAIFVGIIATAILQSSSIVSLILLAFVGAKIINLKSALGVILGCNLGTTFTGWIIATLGFKFNINEISYYLIAIGIIQFLLSSKFVKLKNISKLSMSLGVLFLGLVYMKDATSHLSQIIDLSLLNSFPLIIFLIFGFIITAIIQSSSAMMIITLTALNADLLNIAQAASIIIGADLGTTITTLLGAWGADIIKKRVALAHFSFNLITDTIAFLMMPLIFKFLMPLPISDPLFALVLFHSVFNIIGILIFYPFLNIFESFLNKRFTKNKTKIPQEILANKTAALTYFYNRFDLILQENIDFSIKSLKGMSQVKDYYEIKKEILSLRKDIIDIQQSYLKKEEIIAIQNISNALTFIAFAIKSIKDIRHDLEDYYIKEYKSTQESCKIIINLFNISKEDDIIIFKDKIEKFYKDTKEYYDDKIINQDNVIESNINIELLHHIKFSIKSLLVLKKIDEDLI